MVTNVLQVFFTLTFYSICDNICCWIIYSDMCIELWYKCTGLPILSKRSKCSSLIFLQCCVYFCANSNRMDFWKKNSCILKPKVKVDSIPMRIALGPNQIYLPLLQEIYSACPQRRPILHNVLCLDVIYSTCKPVILF